MASEPKDIIRIDNIKLLKVISDPTRKKIIDVLYDKPLTASEIADIISYPKDKIYYHIKKLQTNGILIIAESEKVKGITQNKFINAAKKFDIASSLNVEETPRPSKSEEKEEADKQEIDDAIEDDSENTEIENDTPTPEGNPLLASLMKAKGRPAGQITQQEIPATQVDETSDKGKKSAAAESDVVRIIADRRRGGDRRTTTERRKGVERRVKQKRKIPGGEKRSGQERRKGIEKRVLADRRKAIDRRLEAEKRKRRNLKLQHQLKLSPKKNRQQNS